jgi:hypothetical protein
MNNSYFHQYVQEMMPSCMKDLAKMKVWYTNSFSLTLGAFKVSL